MMQCTINQCSICNILIFSSNVLLMRYLSDLQINLTSVCSTQSVYVAQRQIPNPSFVLLFQTDVGVGSLERASGVFPCLPVPSGGRTF